MVHMKLTPMQRRQRIADLMNADTDCSTLLAEYKDAQNQFIGLTDRLPKKRREFLWKFPGAGYFLHHRIISLICEHMRFPDEID